MAGMLPGVESARRRRFHSDSPNPSGYNFTRRSSFCLYTSNHENLHSSSSSMRIPIGQAYCDEKLGAVAREAKKRLDEKLKAQWKSKIKRVSSELQRPRNLEGSPAIEGKEVFGLKKKFNWAKISWKCTEQEECAVCLEHFVAGDTLMQLPCAHKFHSKCLVPWLESNAHCPCCRMEIQN
ncbi:probable E3 ubiquitin- ligase RHY1A [Olea europaea subsp. europaea]|uniref:Probable E3 ubiquitin- ligase RHY1A n=1 Tax=Olea europaea subsp. europaea TaxID=158383 RepID=A0A8S0PYC6_OLEEU|nr:probable E3 ubiquitin- ligase RHY1A [Olea europaea subsp. europaea]